LDVSQFNAIGAALEIGNVLRIFRAAFVIGNVVYINNIFGRKQ
jgi:hypothetical protein